MIPEVVFDEFLLLFTSLSVSGDFSRIFCCSMLCVFRCHVVGSFCPARLACVLDRDPVAAPVGVGVGGLVDMERGP
jgi:hypothetical protein